jgi:hypothetical protein
VKVVQAGFLGLDFSEYVEYVLITRLQTSALANQGARITEVEALGFIEIYMTDVHVESFHFKLSPMNQQPQARMLENLIVFPDFDISFFIPVN